MPRDRRIRLHHQAGGHDALDIHAAHLADRKSRCLTGFPMSAEQTAAVAEYLEVDLLLEGVARAYGVDARSAPRPMIERAVADLRRVAGLPSVAALIDKVLRDREYGEHAAAALGKCIPRLFAEHAFYRVFNSRVIPWLRTYPYLSVW